MARKFNTRYAHTRHKSDGITFTQASLTEQSFAYECDINNIMMKDVRSSLPASNQMPIFDSKFDPTEYNEALNLITSARQQFEALPSHIRARFENSPIKLLEFVNNPDNYDEGVKLGIFEKKPIKIDTPIVKNPIEGTPVASGNGVNQVSSD